MKLVQEAGEAASRGEEVSLKEVEFVRRLLRTESSSELIQDVWERAR